MYLLQTLNCLKEADGTREGNHQRIFNEVMPPFHCRIFTENRALAAKH